MTAVPVLETERLRLRAAEMRDFEVYADYCASDRSHTVGGPFTRDEAFSQLCAIAGQWQIYGYGRWIIADKDSEAALGATGVFHPVTWPEPEIAWTVFADAEGKSIAFEAATVARDHVYDVLGWPTVISCITDVNTRSIALAERMGAKREGGFVHPKYGPLNIWRHVAPEARV